MLQARKLRDNKIYGMNFNFDRDLNGFSGAVLDFDPNNFTSKHIVSPKAQHFLASVLFNKIVHDVDVNFDMTTT